MRFFNTVIFSAFLLMSPLAIAVDQCAAWGCTSVIEDLYTPLNGTKVFVSTPLDESVANCTLYPGGYFVLYTDSTNADMAYSTLLSAYMSNSKVMLRVVEGSEDCRLAYVKLSTLH